MRAAAVATIGLLGLACRPTETPQQAEARMATETAAARQAIDSLNTEFVSHFNQGHASVLAGHYTEAGSLMGPNAPAANGRAAVQSALEGLLAMKPQLSVVVESVVASGPLAVARGSYRMTLNPPGSPSPVTDVGKILVHWQNVDGKWLMAADMFNSDLPVAPGAPTK